jgi:hypothetical protein
MIQPGSHEDWEQSAGDMEVTTRDLICMVVHRTFTISEKIAIADNDDRTMNHVAATEETVLRPQNVLSALKQMYPLSNLEITWDDQNIDQLSAKEAI